MISGATSGRPGHLRKGPIIILILIGMGVLAGGWAVSKISKVSFLSPPMTEDSPGPMFQTKYRNVRPEVQYVGDEACIRCHREMAESYHKHPMAHSLAPVAQADAVERFDTGAHNPFDAQGFRYEIERLDHRIGHTEKRLNAKGNVVDELKAEVQYALGSGIRGRSYLVERQGFLFQSPASWYAGSQTWDLAVGYQSRNQHFTRPVTAECIYCHANRAETVGDSPQHFRTPVFQGYAIGCERCHGPGELHVQLRERDKNFTGEDDTIVVPDRLQPNLRESVCQQCHLQGVVQTEKRARRREDYRPGLPLNLFVSYYVWPPNAVSSKRAVGQVEQMYASRCFQESGKKGGSKLGCLSCHDPHNYPAAAEKLNYYRDRCLTCHEESGCGLEMAARRAKDPGDNCAACHMPRLASSNVAHTAITDHRIVRTPGKDRPEIRRRGSIPEKYPLVPFFSEDADFSNPETKRDLGIALVKLASKRPSAELGQLALPLLDLGLQRWPDDVPALEAKAFALSRQGKNEEALDAFLQILQGTPDREWGLFGAAQLSSQLGRYEAALTLWQRAVRLNPWNWEYHDGLANAYAQRQEWKEAVEQCQEALKLNIAALETRKLLVKCLLQLREKDKAQKELMTLLDFDPPDSQQLKDWFLEENR